MNKTRILQGAVIVLAIALVVVLIRQKPKPAPTNNQTDNQQEQQPPQSNAEVIVDTPQPNDLVTSPLAVKGRALNKWFFEANIPVTLKDTNGNVLAQKGFHSVTDWTVQGFVEFNDTLTFTMPATQYGVLIISKDNPSGDPANDADFTVPVRFW